MSRAVRMLQIIRLLRGARGARTAQEIADELEVNRRTVYRDVASLQALDVPIEGEPGIGYVMRPGLGFPPIDLGVEEVEAVTVGLALVQRTGDRGLKRAARRVATKLAVAAPSSGSLFASTCGPDEPRAVNLPAVRRAIRDERKIGIDYHDGDGVGSRRTLWPLAIRYHSAVIVIAGWCELREDFRHFRADRVDRCVVSDEAFTGRGAALRRRWLATCLEMP